VSTLSVARAIWLTCAGCGYRAPVGEPFPIRCPARVPGDDVDHVMTRVLDPGQVRFPAGWQPNPFVRYRELFHAWHVARAAGWSDARYVELVERLDRSVAAVDGRGFSATPFERHGPLSERLGFGTAGGVWVKDETGNVSGSHKARHLMGAMIELLVAEATGLTGDGSRPLAIASCGNAALAAAVVARAAGRRLDVFVPTSADPSVVERLEGLGARVTACPREPGAAGDPTYRRLQTAIAAGAIPFTCQGTENGLAIEGGETLGYEMVSELVRGGRRLDRLVVQVGGGALASACAQAFAEAGQLGVVDRQPRIHAVQTRGCWPLKRAFDRVAGRIRERIGPIGDGLDLDVPDVRSELAYVACHRSEFMWPWESEPRSIAHGILDDETYDWLAVARGMLATGGYPVVVSEALLAEANALAREVTGIDADHTGTAGLAGLMEIVREGAIRPDETVAIIFTGIRRGGQPLGATERPGEQATP
jgi:threonine synthase